MSKMTAVALVNSSLTDVTTRRQASSRDSYGAVYSKHVVIYMLWQIVPPVLLLLGCFGNVMTMVVMRAMRSSQSIACLSLYFRALAVSDLFLLVSSVLWYWPEIAFDAPLDYFSNLSCSMFYFVCYVSTFTSAWFLVAMTCQRMTSVIFPHRVGILCSVRRGKMVIFTIVAVSCAAYVHVFFTFRVEYVDDGYWVCIGYDKSIEKAVRIVDLWFTSVIPFLFLIVGNIILVRSVFQSVRMSEKLSGLGEKQTMSRMSKTSSMTVTLILTSLVFLLFTFPACALDFYMDAVGFYRGQTNDEQQNAALVLADTVCVLLWISSSVFNFYIYILRGSKFREETRRCLCLHVDKTRQFTTDNTSSRW